MLNYPRGGRTNWEFSSILWVFRSWCDLHTPRLSIRLFISSDVRTICFNLIGPMWTSLPLIGWKGDNLAFKFYYRTWIWLSKILTRQEFGSQMSLPDILPKLKTFDLSHVLLIYMGSHNLLHWLHDCLTCGIQGGLKGSHCLDEKL